MKIPRTPPSIQDQLHGDSNKLIKILTVSQSLPENNEQYLHWDEFRHRPLPEGSDLSKEEIWAAMKLRRLAGKMTLPFTDIKGKPLYVNRPDSIFIMLRQIDLRAGGTIATNHTNFNAAALQYQRGFIEESYNSSVLEGAATTRKRAKELIRDKIPAETNSDKMVYNNYRAMEFVKDNRDSPLTTELILTLHSIITEGTLDDPNMAGKFRQGNNIVVKDMKENILHSPPDHTELSERMDALCTFANKPEADFDYFMHPIVQAILLHFQIAYDHPFVDGNGRTARAIFYWAILKSNYWLFEYVSISKVIKEAPAKYGRAFLHTETDGNDTTYFVIHQLKTLLKSITNLEKYLELQKQKFAEFDTLIKDYNLNHRQTKLLNSLVRKQIENTSISQYEIDQQVSYITARKDLETLAASGLLTKTMVGRKGFYRVHPDAVKHLG